MVLEAKRRWQVRGIPGEVGFLTLTHVGDNNGYVSIDRVALVGHGVHLAFTLSWRPALLAPLVWWVRT
jgi:hypothetical protein